jgi:hypothetical protein
VRGRSGTCGGVAGSERGVGAQEVAPGVPGVTISANVGLQTAVGKLIIFFSSLRNIVRDENEKKRFLCDEERALAMMM